SSRLAPGDFCLYELVLEGERPGRRPRGDAQLREDVLHVAGDGVLADHERGGDLAVAPTGRDEAQHLELARREAVVGSGRPRQSERVDPGKVRLGAELREDLPGGVELARDSVVIPEPPAGE